LTLCWAGPVGAGHFPATREGLEALMVPGVYLRTRAYAGGRRVSYVGQSRNLLARFDQHLTALLGLTTTLRDARGQVAFQGAAYERLLALDSVEALAALAAAEARRTRFFYAALDEGIEAGALNAVEGLLLIRVRALAAAAAGLIEADNRVHAPAGDDDLELTIISDPRALDPEDRELIEALVGTAPIHQGVPALAGEG
jgi:hypothetical protein